MSEQISKEEAKKQVVLMAQRTAKLYQAFAETLVERFGKEETKEIISDAIYLFGKASGERVQKGVKEKNLDLTISNYSKISDLPSVGWEMESEVLEEDKDLKVDVSYCPLAEEWLKDMDPELARLYCYVDQAKYSTYNPDITCTHTRNMLDGDEKCTLRIRKNKS